MVYPEVILYSHTVTLTLSIYQLHPNGKYPFRGGPNHAVVLLVTLIKERDVFGVRDVGCVVGGVLEEEALKPGVRDIEGNRA
jgi:hypothetical protein